MEKETDTETGTFRKLKESEWIVIGSLWEAGDVTLKELREKFNVTEAALSQGLKRRGMKRGAKAHLASKEVEEKAKEEREKLVEEIFHFKKKFIRYGDFLMTLAMNEITEAKKSGSTIASKKPELEAIFSATKVYKTVRNDMFHLYDLYNTEQAPNEDLEFNIGVYTDNDLKALREAQEIYAREFNSLDDDNDNDTIPPETE